jgi:hypothetical protein
MDRLQSFCGPEIGHVGGPGECRADIVSQLVKLLSVSVRQVVWHLDNLLLENGLLEIGHGCKDGA